MVFYSMKNEKDFESISHELNHAWQFEKGKISIKGKGGGLLYDITDEIESYNVSNSLIKKGTNKSETTETILNPDREFYKFYKDLPLNKMSLNKENRELLKAINKNGMVDYYINWRKDLK